MTPALFRSKLLDTTWLIAYSHKQEHLESFAKLVTVRKLGIVQLGVAVCAPFKACSALCIMDVDYSVMRKLLTICAIDTYVVPQGSYYKSTLRHTIRNITAGNPLEDRFQKDYFVFDAGDVDLVALQLEAECSTESPTTKSGPTPPAAKSVI